MKFEEIKTGSEMKSYLDSYHYYTSAFHCTSLASLIKICQNNTLLFSQIKNMNDKIEADFAPNCHDYFFCLMKSTLENFGLWAMYGGGFSPRKKGETTEDIFVKIEFTYEQIKTLREYNKEIQTRAVAYTQMIKKENDKKKDDKSQLYFCGGTKTNFPKPIDKNLGGYIKDVAWKYENELRFCIKGSSQDKDVTKVVSLPENFISQLIVRPSPMYTVKEVEKIFMANADAKGKANCPIFKKSDYEGAVIVKDKNYHKIKEENQK